MLNKCNILALADVIEKMPDEQFDMGTWGMQQSCGTVACIAGWAHHLTPEADRKENESATGRAKLGLGHWQADELFLGYERGPNDNLIDIPLETITNQWAAACLRNLAETGRVEWTKTKPDHLK
jgi:hypothetical protein